MARRKTTKKTTARQVKVRVEKGSAGGKRANAGVKQAELLDISREWEKMSGLEEAPAPAEIKGSRPDRRGREMAEQDKKEFMWAVVSFFMILFIVIWVFNLKNVFKPTEEAATANTENNEGAVDWSKVRDEFSATMEEMRNAFDEFNQEVDNSTSTETPAEENINNAVPAGGEESGNVSAEEVKKLEDKLEQGE